MTYKMLQLVKRVILIMIYQAQWHKEVQFKHQHFNIIKIMGLLQIQWLIILFHIKIAI